MGRQITGAPADRMVFKVPTVKNVTLTGPHFMTPGSIRWKLFVLITCSVALPVAVLTSYFPVTRVRALEVALTIKASSFSRMLVDETRSAIAFDDSETAREVLEAVTDDEDVVFVALLRADGSVLKSVGSRYDTAEIRSAAATVSRPPGRVRVVAPVLTDEGPRGVLVVDLSTARAGAEGVRTRNMALIMGLGGLIFACVAAWTVGTSFGRRVGRVQAEATRVAAGDLSENPVVDVSRDEIGELARAFRTMVLSLNQAYAGIEGQVRDRTEALASSREQFRALVETTDAVPWEMSVGSWGFTYLGPQAASLLGVSVDSWSDAREWQRHLPAAHLAAVMTALENTLAGHAEEALEFPIQRGEQRPMWIRMLIGAAFGDPVTTLRGFMFDVTERAELEAELRQAQKLESVGRLASGVAHEINTPIQFVSDSVHFVRTSFTEIAGLLDGYRILREAAPGVDATAELVKLAQVEADMDLAYLTENVPKALDRAIDGLDRVATIVRSMKEFAHPDQSEKTSVDLNRALANTLLIARHEYREVADVETEFGELPSVRCQIGELNQAFLNIVVNAAHAIADVAKNGKENGKENGERGRIRVVTRQDGDDAVVEISDTGGGIPEGIRARVFDPFFTTKEVGRGTGQGLPIAHRSIVERHGGTLTFETTMGQGTTFVVRIPLGTTGSVA